MNIRQGHEDTSDSSPGNPPNREGVERSLHSGCTAGDDMGTVLGSRFVSGLVLDTSRAAYARKRGRTRMQARLNGWHVSAKGHGDLPSHGLRQAESRRGHQGPSKYHCLEAWWGWCHRRNGAQTGWESESWERRQASEKAGRGGMLRWAGKRRGRGGGLKRTKESGEA